MARLIDKDLPLDGEERRVRYRTTPSDLDPFLKTWDNSFRNWGDDAVELGTGFYRLKADGGDMASAESSGDAGERRGNSQLESELEVSF